LTAEEARGLLDAREVSSVELTAALLARIEEVEPSLHAFVTVDRDGALRAAREADAALAGGEGGFLRGIPVGVKDLMDVEGLPTEAGSEARRGWIATRDAPVVATLRAGGAVILGKTVTHEFAFGSESPPARNAWDPTRIPGGSSGGSAAAVATGMGVASIGSDTGGSIRIPAAACGVVGIKPSLGEVPTEGVVPLSKTLDHVGPLARRIDDAAAVWAVIAARPIPRLEAPRTLTLGALGDYFTALLTADVRAAFEDALERLRVSDVVIEPRTVRGSEQIVEAYTNISLPEAAHWHAPTLDERASDYQGPVRERLERGRTIAAVSYLRAMDRREQLRVAVDAALEGCDALVLPTLPIVAPPLGALDATMDNGDTIPVRAAMLRLTQLFNITGHPAISLPIASSGLPVGMQLVGHRDRTEDLISISSGCARIGG
jgi:aspartyl-tRNA(Asn)/glutamyl-tRNA(Gln) amidotransferase subunit A